MAPRISVILPTYNRAASLPGAMASVLAQSIGDLELLVIDDASSDDIGAIVERTGDVRVRCIRRSRNGGAAAARNTGIAEARGDFIAFQDSDDIWLPGKLELQLRLLSGLPREFGAVTGPKILYGRDDHLSNGPGRVSVTPSAKRRLPQRGDQVGALLDENRLSVQCALFRSGCMPTRRWFDECARANEDWEFAVRLAQHTRIFEHPEPVVLGFISGDSISKSQRRQMIGELRILKHNRRLLASYGKQKAALLRDVARVLLKGGKPRWGRRFLMQSLAEHPASILELWATAWRRAGRLNQSLRQRLGLA